MKKILIVGEHSYIGNSFESFIKSSVEYVDNWIVSKVSAVNGRWRGVALSKFDVVLLVAGIVHVKETEKNKGEYYRINRDMVIEIAKKSKENGVSLFIYISSMAVYGSDATRITKDTLPHPTSHYGKSKYQAEEQLLKLKTQGCFDVAIVRPPMVYGKGCKGNYDKLYKIAKYMPFFPDVQNRKSIISIQNLCFDLVKIINNNKSDIYHIKDPEDISVTKLYVTIRQSLGKKTIIIKVPSEIMSYAISKSNFMKKIFGDCYYDIIDY